MPVNDHFNFNGHVLGAIKLMADEADLRQAFYTVAISGTLLVVNQICVAEHDMYLLSRCDICIITKLLSQKCFLDNAFPNQFLVFCIALCGLMV
jgi:hypothetical protein